MATLEYRKLSDEEIGQFLQDFSGWSREGDEIRRVFEFKTYKDGLVFASAVGFLADSLDHHPDIHIAYAKVEVRVSTHAVSGLSPYDVELARRVELLVA